MTDSEYERLQQAQNVKAKIALQKGIMEQVEKMEKEYLTPTSNPHMEIKMWESGKYGSEEFTLSSYDCSGTNFQLMEKIFQTIKTHCNKIIKDAEEEFSLL